MQKARKKKEIYIQVIPNEMDTAAERYIALFKVGSWIEARDNHDESYKQKE